MTSIFQHECPECGEAAVRLCSGILVCENCEAGFGPQEGDYEEGEVDE